MSTSVAFQQVTALFQNDEAEFKILCTGECGLRYYLFQKNL